MMSEDRDTLQFDSVVPPPLPDGAPAVSAGISCAACRRAIHDDYFDVIGQSLCASCRARILEHAEPAKGWATLAVAAVFGAGAAIAGALLYYAVLAITNLEIGLVAIAIGYMVGWAVRKGASGRGGLRLQVLAVALTYLSVSLAYGGLAIGAAISDMQKKAASTSAPANGASATGTAAADTALVADAKLDADTGPGSVSYLAFLGLILSLPVIVVFSDLPGGLLSGAIIGFGMMQAWRLTAAPQLQVSGPYRVGPSPVT
jgi:hypothetical protein